MLNCSINKNTKSVIAQYTVLILIAIFININLKLWVLHFVVFFYFKYILCLLMVLNLE